jgi:hypothetical protein
MNLKEVVTRVAVGISMKSSPIVPPRREGTGKGYKRPAGRPCSALTRWQVGQVRMKVSTSVARVGHHTVRRAKDNILSLPKCPPRGVA